MTRQEIERMAELEERNAELARENAELRKKQSNFTNGSTSNVNGIETFFMTLVNEGKLQQMPANYDCATFKMYISHLEKENAELKARLEKAVELKAKRGDILYLPWVYNGNAAVATLQITGTDFHNDELIYITDLESDSAVYLAKYKYGIFRSEDFDNKIFTDRTKAEQRLAELKGGKE